MLSVNNIEYIKDYKYRIRFNNGIEKEIDFASELYGEVFEPLKDAALFKRAYLNPDTQTIEWENGADFAPEYLFQLGKDIKKTA